MIDRRRMVGVELFATLSSSLKISYITHETIGGCLDYIKVLSILHEVVYNSSNFGQIFIFHTKVLGICQTT